MRNLTKADLGPTSNTADSVFRGWSITELTQALYIREEELREAEERLASQTMPEGDVHNIGPQPWPCPTGDPHLVFVRASGDVVPHVGVSGCGCTANNRPYTFPNHYAPEVIEENAEEHRGRLSALRDQNAALVGALQDEREYHRKHGREDGMDRCDAVLASLSQAAADWRAEVERPLREALERVALTYRKRIHAMEKHSQHFERCEYSWCNPTTPIDTQDSNNDDPAGLLAAIKGARP